MKYLMVTSWENHWNKLGNSFTYYTKQMFREGMKIEYIKNNTKTIFIKINPKTKTPEKAWEGRVTDFCFDKEKIKFNDKEKIKFKVFIEKEIDIPKEYQNKLEGWYLIEDEESKFVSEIATNFFQKFILYPPFFALLQETKDWKQFENYVYFLLKLIGINDIYKYEEQRGHPDGFFKFKRLAVLYDCTLEKEFINSKKQQIENFCSQLSNNTHIRIGNNDISIKDCFKEVWIITKGQSQIIKKVDDIKVKEISIFSLFEIFFSRLTEITNAEKLEKKLIEIGDK